MTNSWTFRRRSEVERFWSEVRDVPRRSNGRKHSHEERYCLGLYLLALATHEMLTYPLRVEQSESPDFMLTWSSGEATGLEVTRATTVWLQRKMTAAENEFAGREAEAARSGGEAEPVGFLCSQAGWAFDQAELEWCWLVGESIEKKLDKLPRFKRASRHDLLIYDDTPVPAHPKEALAAMKAWVRALGDRRGFAFGKISAIKSLDVAFDLGGDFRLLPFVDWTGPEHSDPQKFGEFTERVEYAGQVAAARAIEEHIEAHEPVYFADRRGQLFKQTADGRLFHVSIGEQGEEVVIEELLRA